MGKTKSRAKHAKFKKILYHIEVLAEMSRETALIFVRLMVALILLECLLAVCVPRRIAAPSNTYIAEKSFAAAFGQRW
jgi:hypothetical protein